MLARIGTCFLLLAGTALWACGVQPTADELDVTLHGSYGSLTEDPEAPDFDDTDIAEAPDLNGDEDEAIVDTTAEADPALAEAERDTTGARRLLIAVMWGHLRPRPAATEETDWSGKFSITNGALRVRRTLRFEDHDQLLPRPDAQTIEFNSKTQPHADGLLVEVILHPRLVTDPDSPPVISMETAAYSDTLPLHPGMRLSRVVRVDDTGNAVAYHIFRPSYDGCHEGLMVGRFTSAGTTDDGRMIGRLKGKYLAYDGAVAGKIKGIYGERRDGQQLFFGKVIKRDGEFRGTLAGRYQDGRFRGRYLGAGRQVMGAFQGLYREAPAEQGGGFFIGRWTAGCGELSTEGRPDGSDDDNEAVEVELPAEG